RGVPRLRERGDRCAEERAAGAVRDPEGDDPDRESDRGYVDLEAQDRGEWVPEVPPHARRPEDLRAERLPAGRAGRSARPQPPDASAAVHDQVRRWLGEG